VGLSWRDRDRCLFPCFLFPPLVFCPFFFSQLFFLFSPPYLLFVVCFCGPLFDSPFRPLPQTRSLYTPLSFPPKVNPTPHISCHNAQPAVSSSSPFFLPQSISLQPGRTPQLPLNSVSFTVPHPDLHRPISFPDPNRSLIIALFSKAPPVVPPPLSATPPKFLKVLTNLSLLQPIPSPPAPLPGSCSNHPLHPSLGNLGSHVPRPTIPPRTSTPAQAASPRVFIPRPLSQTEKFHTLFSGSALISWLFPPMYKADLINPIPLLQSSQSRHYTPYHSAVMVNPETRSVIFHLLAVEVT